MIGVGRTGGGVAEGMEDAGEDIGLVQSLFPNRLNVTISIITSAAIPPVRLTASELCRKGMAPVAEALPPRNATASAAPKLSVMLTRKTVLHGTSCPATPSKTRLMKKIRVRAPKTAPTIIAHG